MKSIPQIVVVVVVVDLFNLPVGLFRFKLQYYVLNKDYLNGLLHFLSQIYEGSLHFFAAMYRGRSSKYKNENACIRRTKGLVIIYGGGGGNIFGEPATRKQYFPLPNHR
jgi:hypothetical protein